MLAIFNLIMILFTTGTGNSQYVALSIARQLEDKCFEVKHLLDTNSSPKITLAEGERLIFVMPIHSWGPALFMMRFVASASIEASEAWAIFVCGDNCGNADSIFAKALKKKNIKQLGAMSVQMPNNYILMKGFGIDTEEVAKQKLDNSLNRITSICNAIKNKVWLSELYVRGNKAWLKSGLVYPLFRKMAVKRVLFRNTDKCIGCGKCVKVCPTHNISLIEGHPMWGKDCVQCVACIHRCPYRAIEYGDISVDMGRYQHPCLND